MEDWIAGKPALILWGMKDIAFRARELKRWKSLFPGAEVRTFDDAGHFVQEEKGEDMARLIEKHLGSLE
jgi:haloalkane dehalogenase